MSNVLRAVSGKRILAPSPNFTTKGGQQAVKCNCASAWTVGVDATQLMEQFGYLVQCEQTKDTCTSSRSLCSSCPGSLCSSLTPTFLLPTLSGKPIAETGAFFWWP